MKILTLNSILGEKKKRLPHLIAKRFIILTTTYRPSLLPKF